MDNKLTFSENKIQTMSGFLNTKVVNKYQQPWKNLTIFLKKNRLNHFFSKNDCGFEEVDQKRMLRRLSNGNFDNKNVVYDSDCGEIIELKT